MSECEKLAKHTDEWNAIMMFLEWLGQNGMCIGVWRDPEEMAKDMGKTVEEIKFSYAYLLEHPYPYGEPKENLLYRYFEIDTAKVEQERRKLLADLREKQQH